MKILPDECLPLDSRHSFPDNEALTVQWAYSAAPLISSKICYTWCTG
jgi:hypothetical protein